MNFSIKFKLKVQMIASMQGLHSWMIWPLVFLEKLYSSFSYF